MKRNTESDKERKIGWKKLERWHCGATGDILDKDSKGQRKLEDSGVGLLPAVAGSGMDKDRESWRTLA